MRCEIPGSSDLTLQCNHSWYNIPATSANSTPPLSRPLCASHEVLTTRRYCHASIPFRTLVRHLPCLVLATTNTATSNNHLHICTSIYHFYPGLFWVLIRGWEDIGWRAFWLGFAYRPVSLHAIPSYLKPHAIPNRKSDIYTWKNTAMCFIQLSY
jgi:hypothetical protein